MAISLQKRHCSEIHQYKLLKQQKNIKSDEAKVNNSAVTENGVHVRGMQSRTD